jgi:5,10-methenyltetrahydrofolate synthetase
MMPDIARPPAPGDDRHALRRQLIAARRSLPDRGALVVRVEAVLRAWLGARTDGAVGAYWPIRGEIDPLPVLAEWAAGAPGRRIGLPVIDPATQRLEFHAWWPGAPMRQDVFGIPIPDGTGPVAPTLLLVPCVGYGPSGVRLGYGGGFYDRTLAAAGPRPATAGIAFASAYVPELVARAHDIPLDAILTEDGIAWERPG